MRTNVSAQRFYPFIRDEKQWLKDGDAEIGPFEAWSDAKRYIAKHRANKNENASECLSVLQRQT
jgi:hypothetical protein